MEEPLFSVLIKTERSSCKVFKNNIYAVKMSFYSELLV